MACFGKFSLFSLQVTNKRICLESKGTDKLLITWRETYTELNPLVQSVLFWPFFHFFSPKERVPLNQFFWRDHLNDRWAFFYQLMLISRSLSKGLIFRTQKSEGRFDPKKNFFRLLNTETTLKCFTKQKKNFWKIFFEKNFEKLFLKKFFSKFFLNFIFESDNQYINVMFENAIYR